MSTTGARTATAQAVEKSAALNELATRVLSLLSVSSWIPSSAATMAILYLSELARLENLNLLDAFDVLGEKGWRYWVAAIAGVLAVNIITQSFQYSMIRTLEGYWSLNKVTCKLCEKRINAHRNRRRKANMERVRLAKLRTGEPDALLERRIEAHRREFKSYPEVRLLMPTKLGNVLRKHEEDASELADERIETLLGQVIADVPDRVRYEHDMHRTRLDMYSHLTFVWASALVATALAVGHNWFVSAGQSLSIDPGRLAWGVITLAGATLLTWVSYGAAVRAAGAYGYALATIGGFHGEAERQRREAEAERDGQSRRDALTSPQSLGGVLAT